MKRLMAIISVLLMLLGLTVAAQTASDTEEPSLEDTMERLNAEIEAVEATIEKEYELWSEYLTRDEEGKISCSYMFRVFSLTSKDMVSAYKNQGSIADMVSDNYYWMVPCGHTGRELQVVRSETSDTGWMIRQGSSYGEGMKKLLPDVSFDAASMYENVVSNYPDVDRASGKAVYDSENEIFMVYFTAKGKEYISPYFASADIDWVTNRGIYEAEDYISFMESGRDTDDLSAIPQKDTTAKLYVVYIVIGTAVVALATGIAVAVMKRKK